MPAKTTYYAQRPLRIDNHTIERGRVVATIEAADGVPPERAIRAIAAGQATPDKPETKTEKRG